MVGERRFKNFTFAKFHILERYIEVKIWLLEFMLVKTGSGEACKGLSSTYLLEIYVIGGLMVCMNTVDAAIKYLKGELMLSEEGKEELLRKLYNYRFTQFIYYRGVRLTGCVGNNELGWLLVNQHFIQKMDIVTFNGQDYVVTESIAERFRMKNDGMPIQLEYINGLPC